MTDQADRLRELMRLNRKEPVPAPVASDTQPEDHQHSVGVEALVPEVPVTFADFQSRVLVVTSGKGGVGKTNVTVNLALALSKQNKRTILFDADLGMANVDVILGVSPKASLVDVMEGKKTLTDILVKVNDYLEIVPGGSGMQELANLDQKALDGFLIGLRELEHRADFILVDTGAGISRAVLNFVLAASEVLVVTTPEPTAITDAYGLIKVIDQHNPSACVHLLVNMAETEHEARSVAQKLIMIVDRFLEIEVRYLACLERDPYVVRAVLQQQPFYLAFPNGPATRRINALANLLINDDAIQAPESQPGGFFQRLARLFR
jgi:flagellar biosynthesis protein FlhG